MLLGCDGVAGGCKEDGFNLESDCQLGQNKTRSKILKPGLLYRRRVLCPRLLGFTVSYTAEPHVFKKEEEK
jgi:hypothetical protein